MIVWFKVLGIWFYLSWVDIVNVEFFDWNIKLCIVIESWCLSEWGEDNVDEVVVWNVFVSGIDKEVKVNGEVFFFFFIVF